MIKFFFTLALAISVSTSFGQRIAKIIMSQSGILDMITYEIETDVMVNISDEGNVINWGTDLYKDGRIENFGGRLAEYPGKLEYYSASDNEAYRGKLKYIGKTLLTYFASHDDEALRGKLKSIGATNFEYYASYDEKALKGKIKNAGSVPFAYFTSFDNEAFQGKIKSVGITSLTYYSSFDDKSFKGKIKSIDRTSFTYYASFDKIEYRGMMKSGFQSQLINGIKFLVRN